MADVVKRTANGKCLACGLSIAWHKSEGRYRLFNPQRGADGVIVRKAVDNGKGRIVNRPVPDLASPHRCDHPAVMPVGAPAPIPPIHPADAAAQLLALPDAARPIDTDAVLAAVRPLVRGEMVAILDEYGVKPPAVEIVVKAGDNERKVEGVVHPLLSRLISLLGRREHVYLGGPAGTGKTFGLQQAAKALGLRSAVQPMPGIQSPSRVFGFEDAHGRFVSTVFADYFENGGLFIADEFDRMIPQVAAAFNAPLANRIAVFGGRTVTAHPDFIVGANGNTDMRGATVDYTAGQPIDYATVSRFAYLDWTLDVEMERKLVRAVLPDVKAADKVLEAIYAARCVIAVHGMEKILAGPREAQAVARDVASGTSLQDALDTYVFRGLSPVDRERFANA